MINYQNMKVSIASEGLGRKQRPFKSLDYQYVNIDDRTIEDLFEFVKQYAKELRFIDINGNEDNWELFFKEIPKRDGQASPHLALLMGFLELFKLSQQTLNNVTKRHLDYYYKDVLKLSGKEAKADLAHIVLDLARTTASLHLKKGTLFSGGNDENGDERFYKLVSDAQLTKAQVCSVRSLFIDNSYSAIDNKVITRTKGIHANEVWNEEIKSIKWHALGTSKIPHASVGFAITAPILFLPEGERTIKISTLLHHIGNSNLPDIGAINELLADNFLVELSTRKGWLKKKPELIKVTQGNNELELILSLQLSLEKSEEGIEAPGEEVKEQLPKKWPIMKLLLNPDSSYEYQLLKQFQFTTIDIDVHVDDVKNIIVQNNESVLDPNAPFYPFTITPGVNADFIIGSNEIFTKELTSLDIKMEWYNVPDEQLGNHYSEYQDYYQDQDLGNLNQAFKADLEILKNKDWFQVSEGHLFSQDNARLAKRLNITIPGFDLHDTFDDLTIPDEPFVEVENLEGGNLGIGAAEELEAFESYDIKSQRGFIRLKLSEPDFGHNAYPNLYARAITANNNLDPANPVVKPLPNQPYTPQLKSVSLSYSATKEIDTYSAEKYFFQLHPFGHQRLNILKEEAWLFPQLTGEGQLLIGLKSVQPQSEISLLIQALEGTSDPDVQIPKVQWSYLHKDKWTDFPSSAIRFDSTENLNTPGIVTLAIPSEISFDSDSMPKDQFWIRASADQFSRGTCMITSIQSQAVLVESLLEKGIDQEQLSIPSDTITQLLDPISEIKKIAQPFPSLGGRNPEPDKDFYQRISERLRHKNRAVSAWDLERLVIERFPEVYKVKCFPHTSAQTGFSPGQVLLIVIPDIRHQVEVDTLKPAASLHLRESIQQFLKKRVVAQVGIEVKNPLFESIELEFMVKFRPGYHNGLYESKLQDELRKYLAPWAFEEGREIGLGGKIYKSAVLDFVEERDYVEYVTFFKMNQYDQNGNARLNVEEANAITPVSILTTVADHRIRVIEEDAVCADGIGHMIIEDSFITVK